MAMSPLHEFHEDLTNIFKLKAKNIRIIIRIIFQVTETIPIIIQPPTDSNVYCGSMCTNTGDAQSTASSSGGSALN